MAEPYLAFLVNVDWSATYRKQYFCFRCLSSFCRQSCSDHTSAHHAGHHVPVPAHVVEFSPGNPAILTTHVKGSGYDWSRIQRLGKGAESCIPLVPLNPPDGRLAGECSRCNGCCKRSFLYCSLACKVEMVQGGRNRAMAQRLVDLAPSFGAQTHRRDRFCTRCFRAFCYNCCSDHIGRHHVHAAAAGHGEGDLLVVEHLEGGWAVVEAGQLPPHAVDTVQELQMNGRVFYPVHNRRNAVPAAGPPPPHPCNSAICFEEVGPETLYCSLRCRQHG